MNPNPCRILIKFAVDFWIPFKCWKYDLDRLNSYWGMASQSQKTGGTLIQAGALIRRNTVSQQPAIKCVPAEKSCFSGRCTLQWIFQQPVMTESCFNFINTIAEADEAVCNIRLKLHWKKLFYKFWWLPIYPPVYMLKVGSWKLCSIHSLQNKTATWSKKQTNCDLNKNQQTLSSNNNYYMIKYIDPRCTCTFSSP